MTKGFTINTALRDLRVEMPAYSDVWMRGAQFGRITGVVDRMVTDKYGIRRMIVVRIKPDHGQVKSQYFPLKDCKVFMPRTHMLHVRLLQQHFCLLIDMYASGNCNLEAGDRIGTFTIQRIGVYTVEYKDGMWDGSHQLPFIDEHGNLTKAGEIANGS